MLNISLAAEKIGSVGGFPITNSFLATYFVMAFLIAFSFLATRKMTLVPNTLQLIAESVVGGLYDFFSAIAGEHVKKFFPVIGSLFIYILISNWIGLLPGFSTIGFYHTPEAKAEAPIAQEESLVKEVPPETTHTKTTVKETTAKESKTVLPEPTISAPVAGESATTKPAEEKAEFIPLLRGPTADLNMTLALAVVAVVAMQYFGFAHVGAHYLSRFINFKDPINLFVGILELVSDISKVISFAFRLFGNIFAGEVLLAVMAFLMPFLVPLPFLMMELFVGVVQALVFSMLSTAFFMIAVSHGEEEHG